MRRFPILGALLAVPAMVMIIVAAGCSGTSAPTGPTVEDTGAAPSGEKKVLEGKGWAKIKGKVTYDGDAPKPADLAERDDFKKQQDKDHCLKGPHLDPSWKVGDDKGVADVVVWVKPAGNDVLPLPPDDKKFWADEIVVDQPFCIYEPHVSVAYQYRYNPKTKKLDEKTGQKVTIANSAPITHNTKFQGKSTINPGGNLTLTAGKKEAVDFKADPTTVISLSCDVHKWMTGYVWSLDHPYAAVTKGGNEKDKDKFGEFEIPVPAGIELYVVGWHEGNNWVLPEGGPKSEGMKIGALKDGEEKVVDFKVKKK